MPKIIRSKCFETNSSSCHSLSLEFNDKNVIRDTISRLKGITIEVKFQGYYGGDYDLLSVEDKLSYIFSDLVPDKYHHNLIESKLSDEIYRLPEDLRIRAVVEGTYSSYKFNEDILRKVLNEEPISELINWFENLTGASIKFSTGHSGWVGVDHESAGMGRSLIERGEDKHKLQSFLFDPRNTIRIKYC